MDADNQKLDRSISLFQATVYGVGIILGAGIYALIGEAAGIAGNSVWISFLVAALIAGFSALSYAELAAVYPLSAAEFIYVKKITGSAFAGFFFGYLTVLTGIISVAAVALGFATYFKLYTSINSVWIGIAVIVASAMINFTGIQQSARVNTVFTFVEVVGLLFIIFVGLPYLGSVDLLAQVSEKPGDLTTWKPVMAGAALVFFAYIGFEDVANIAEETTNPARNVPLALLLSLLITTIIYLLVAMVAVSVVPASALFEAVHPGSQSEGPLALVASTALNSPVGGNLFTVIALCATANTVLILHIVTSRMIFGMAREKCLPAAMAKINPRTRTPANAVLVTTILCMLFTLSGSLGDVANLTNVGVFMVFLAVNLMVIIQRYQIRHDADRLRQVSLKMALNAGWFPVLPFVGAVFCLVMLTTQFWGSMNVLGQQMPIIMFSGLIALVSIPLYLLGKKVS